MANVQGVTQETLEKDHWVDLHLGTELWVVTPDERLTTLHLDITELSVSAIQKTLKRLLVDIPRHQLVAMPPLKGME
jgi:hypothetical protein